MADEQLIDERSIEQKESGIASTVYRGRLQGTTERWIAIKLASSRKRFTPEPHDILKEIRLLSSISHTNIISIVGSKRTSESIELWTPWITYNLKDLLNLPTFTPSRIPLEVNHLVLSTSSNVDRPTRADIFLLLTKSIAYQISSAVEFLHALSPPIAHRDIKPWNVLLTETACVKLIDFGIAYCEDVSKDGDHLWPEKVGSMYSDVATGPFRAPELLFGARSYDACATDLWSIGTTIAHFFTPIQLLRKAHYDEEDEEHYPHKEEEAQVEMAYILPKDTRSLTWRSAEWMRRSLFDGRRGSIGLAGSIFKIRGTPSAENWPDFESLPDANKVQFKAFPTLDLRSRLPNLPPNTESAGSTHAPPPTLSASPLDLIHRLLVFPPQDRLKARDILQHPWFMSSIKLDESEADGDVPLLLPLDGSVVCSYYGKDLGEWLQTAFKRR